MDTHETETIKLLELIESLREKEIFTDEEYETIKLLSKYDDWEVRNEVAVLLCDDDIRSEKILVQLLNDSDDLVRTNACDSLCYSSSVDVLHLLMNKTLKDRSSLVRAYAALSAGDIASNISYNTAEMKAFYDKAIGKEKAKWVKYYYYMCRVALFKEKEYFELLIKGLEENRYHTRCAAISNLYNLMTDGHLSNSDISRLKEVFTRAYKTEKTVAVKSSIETFMNKLYETEYQKSPL